MRWKNLVSAYLSIAPHTGNKKFEESVVYLTSTNIEKSSAYDFHTACISGSIYANAFDPKIDNGVLLKSKYPSISKYADLVASCLDVHSRLSVSCTWVKNLSHSWIGNFLLTLASAARI